MKITTDNINDFATGVTILGTGGRDDPYIGKLTAQQAIEEYSPVDLIDPRDVPDDALVIPSAMLGALTVMTEKMPKGIEALAAFGAFETHLGQKVYAMMSIEADGLNSTVPIIITAALGLPLVNADGMGRASLEVQMVMLTMGDVSTTLMSIANEKGNSLLANTVSDEYAEAFVRVTSIGMGGACIIGTHALSGVEIREHTILDSTSLTHDIGEAIRTAEHRSQGPVEAVLDLTDGYELFARKTTDVERRTEGGFTVSEAILDGIDDCEGQMSALDFQNKNLITRDSKRGVAASTPDLITVVNTETDDPVTAERPAYSHRVWVIGMPCSSKWRAEKGPDLVGPAYLDYSIDYEPIKTLQQPRHD